MSDPSRCPACGASLPEGAAAGACPRCLLAAGLESGPDEAPEAGVPADLGARFPRLEILELLGRGGMGIVYKARQKDLDRLVALKVLPEDVGAEPAFADRFGREARALARLDHPSIVRVHEFGEADGLYFLLLEYVDGANLREAMEAGRLAPAEALAIVPQICDALQYAHEQGVVHRDIKPENVLIDRKGRVKIADFGLAKLVGAPADAALTRAGQVMGTPHYMAPEQIETPRDVDHRADIYSLGVVFYEMLTGELPLGRFDPPSSKVQMDVRLDGVVLRALEKQRERRYQSVADVKTGVDEVAREPRPAARTHEPQPAAARVSRMAIVGFLALPGTLLLLALVVGALRLAGIRIQGAWTLAAPVGAATLVGFVLSIAAWARIHHSEGRLRGTAFAILGTFMPCVALCGAPAYWVLQRTPAPENVEVSDRPPMRASGVAYHLAPHVTLPLEDLHALQHRVDELWGALQDGLGDRPLEEIQRYLAPSVNRALRMDTPEERARRVEDMLLGIAAMSPRSFPAPLDSYRLLDVHVVRSDRVVCAAATDEADERMLSFELHLESGTWYFDVRPPQTGDSISFEGRTLPLPDPVRRR